MGFSVAEKEKEKQLPVDETQETMILTAMDTLNESQAPRRMAAPEDGRGYKYEIIKKLGKGGFAWVYLVKNLDLDRMEAMKILNTDLEEEEGVIDQAVKEARISANFHHQNIVTVYEVVRKGHWDIFKVSDEVRSRHREPFAYFTMSFIEGETATAMLRRESRLSQKAAVRIIMDACSALEFAHGKGIIHRDIKPDNIMVDRQGRGIVMDFGIAKVLDQTRQTAAGTFMGTVRYVSPEQATGGDIDGRTDIYSLGISLYELLTGRVPFTSDQWTAVLFKHINEAPPDPDKLCPNLDRDLRSIMLTMLEKKREDRFQNAKDCHAALARVYHKLGGEDRFTVPLSQIHTRQDLLKGDATEVTSAPTPTPDRMPTARRGPGATMVVEQPAKSKMPLLAGLAIVVFAAVGTWLWLGRDGTNTPDLVADHTPVASVTSGQLLISAFPKGELVKLANSSGEQITTDTRVLPIRLELPEDTYSVTTVYKGNTQTLEVVVSKNIPLTLAHAEFKIEDDLFLLEDLK